MTNIPPNLSPTFPATGTLRRLGRFVPPPRAKWRDTLYWHGHARSAPRLIRRRWRLVVVASLYPDIRRWRARARESATDLHSQLFSLYSRAAHRRSMSCRCCTHVNFFVVWYLQARVGFSKVILRGLCSVFRFDLVWLIKTYWGD